MRFSEQKLILQIKYKLITYYYLTLRYFNAIGACQPCIKGYKSRLCSLSFCLNMETEDFGWIELCRVDMKHTLQHMQTE